MRNPDEIRKKLYDHFVIIIDAAYVDAKAENATLEAFAEDIKNSIAVYLKMDVETPQ